MTVCRHLGSAARVLALASLATFSAAPAAAFNWTLPWTLPQGTPVRLMIDPGHGGVHSGAAANGIVERDINLDIALRLRDLLEADTRDPSGGGDWDVRMTRETDITVTLSQRSSMANAWPADRFLSIHHNGFSDPAAHGTSTFSFANGTIAADLRDKLHQEILSAIGLSNRGTKTGNFHVLRETSMPSALTEAGFITSPIDAAVLATSAARDALARAHLFALQRHMGHAAYLPTPGPVVYCTAKVNSAGCTPAMGWTGTPTFTGSDFVIHCDQVVSQQFGLFLWSLAPADLPFFGGTLCLGTGLQRHSVSFSGGLTNHDCSGRLEFPVTSQFLVQKGLFPGATVYTQWWYRDPWLLPAWPIGVTDALSFTVLP